MPKNELRFPDAVREFAARRFERRHRNWLAGEGEWPVSIPLGTPDESAVGDVRSGLAEWIAAWQTWKGPGTVVWRERRWRTMGEQRLPERLMVANPLEAARLAGKDHRWLDAERLYRQMSTRWPALAGRLPRWFDELAASSEEDAATFETLLDWLAAHPQSGLFVRQLPVSGMHTKWMEPRLPMIADLLAAIRGEESAACAPHAVCGLRTQPALVRVRLLDPELRKMVGGIGDLSAPVEDLRRLALPVAQMWIVENLQTGLSFTDRKLSAVAMGLGWGVTALAEIPWIAGAVCTYWGDLDTHGFAILNTARAALGNVQSALMDEATLLRHRGMWVREGQQYGAADLPFLTAPERAVYRGLKEHRWGVNVRLEQERIPWEEAMIEMGRIR